MTIFVQFLISIFNLNRFSFMHLNHIMVTYVNPDLEYTYKLPLKYNKWNAIEYDNIVLQITRCMYLKYR